MFRVAFAMVFLAATAAAQETASMLPVVVMTGQAVLHRAPDVAYVTVAVQSRSRSSRDAQRMNADLMNAVRKRLTDAGIPTGALRTLALSLDQEFENDNGRPVPRGYVARNSLEIRLDDVARVGEVADVVVQGGATSVSGVRFDLKDRAGAEREAVRLAVADARGRAEAGAEGAGRSIDRIVRIEDSRSETIPRPLVMMRAESAAGTPVEPGVVDIRAQVVLTAVMK